MHTCLFQGDYMTMGARNNMGAFENTFDGHIEELRFYNTNRTQDQIQTIYLPPASLRLLA